jgi:hypothetical protein
MHVTCSLSKNEQPVLLSAASIIHPSKEQKLVPVTKRFSIGPTFASVLITSSIDQLKQVVMITEKFAPS